MPPRLNSLWYEFAYWISAIGFTFAFSLRGQGGRNMPASGPALLIANHQSYLDPMLVGLVARRHLRFLARKSLYRNRAFAWLLRSLQTEPIDQEGFAREGLKTILAQLQAGRAVLVFPEGQRTPDGALQTLRPGIHLLLKRVAMPIIPVGIAGAYDAWARWHRLPRPAPLFLPPEKGTVAVSIGRPLDGRLFAAMPREQALTELSHEIQKMMEQAERLRRKA
jgi:1-acyl-sn-glycerol-3-phosphate acyltransferase